MIHTPVLVNEILELFQPNQSSRLLDATLGTGGHTKAFLVSAGRSATAVGLDADPQALKVAQAELTQYQHRVSYLNTNFANLKDSIIGGGILKGEPPLFTHILFDLGIGSHQLADPDRGFSFRGEGTLTMSYGQLEGLPEAHVTAINQLTGHLKRYPDAGDLIRELAVKDLAQVVRFYGEERYANRIAGALKSAHPLTTARQLSEVVRQAVPHNYERGRIHPATRTFQALRLAVNRELEALIQALPQAVDLLTKDGRIAVVSFHSLEDRIVKNFFRQSSTLTILTKKPITAGEAERAANPRSRSAKLRAAQKNSMKS